MISLVDKLMMYILGTVGMSLLNVIMMRRMTLLVVPNINRTAYTGVSTVFKTQHHVRENIVLVKL